MTTKLAKLFGLMLLLGALAACSVSIDLTPPPPAGYVRLVSGDSAGANAARSR